MFVRFLFFIIAILISSFSINAQDLLTIEDCYTLAKKNHPIQAKTALLSDQTSLELDILDTHKLPKLELAAQATYQSDVVSLPISLPNINIESPNKEQYKATVTATQLIYNGGLIALQKNTKKTDLATKNQEIAVQVHQLKSKINQLYFSVLLLEQTEEVLHKNQDQLLEKIAEIDKLEKNGILPEYASDPLQIKVLEIQQKMIESDAVRNQLIEKLSILIGKPISNKTQFKLPQIYITQYQNKRPELALFDLQKELVNQNENLLKKSNYPKVVAYGTGGFGNPGLNMLDNSLQEFYMLGAKVQWNIFDWNVNKKQQQALAINYDIIDNQKELFTWQQSMESRTYLAAIEKHDELLKSDKELIELRKRIVETAGKQLKHDIITTADYAAEVNNLLIAEISQKKHEIELELAKANYQVTMFE